MKRVFYICTLTFLFSKALAQSPAPGYEFISNQGQWAEPFLYKTNLPGGELFLEKDRLVYTFWDATKKAAVMESLHNHGGVTTATDALVPAHGIYIRFRNSEPSVQVSGEDVATHYYNFFQSPDPQRWKGKVPVYHKVNYTQLYRGVDLHFYTTGQYLKYDFVVAPGADAGQVQLEYDGAEEIRMENGLLRIKTSVNEWTEQKPYAYQLIGGVKKEVDCAFRLKKNTVSFQLGSYDKNYPLVIDPVLIFATYSGSVRDNWGFTATYDLNDNMYGGGIVFGANTYPGTSGSYQLNFGGGQYDALICKFNATGNNLLFYTYLGGGAADAPCSMVCNAQNQLYVLGVTGSAGFPVTAGAYQNLFGGGPSTGVFALSGNDYPAGADIFVAKLSEDGATLLGSTFMGGTGIDGINLNTSLTHNYADEFRGEIIVDNTDQCYIVSSTSSTNFPLVNPAQGSLSGSQDAVVCKFSSNLTSALFSTYLGGSGAEAGYSVQRNTAGDIYVTGGTTSQNFPTTGGTIHPNYMGGSVDGFLARIAPAGNTILNATYLGTGSYDQCYAVQLDDNQDVHVVGQTTGAYPVSPGVYSNPNSGQFIHKLNPTLSATAFSTVFGRGVPGQIDIVPTAFLVDVCDHIYVAGWGGVVNSGSGGGSTSGLPVTPNAYQSTTDGSDFYLFVLDDNATSLLYATYFGGSVSDEHVDGGTSRFDKNGIVYEAVCAGCGNNNDFPTTPGAWSQTNNSQNCNLGVFKFDVSDFTAIIDPLTPTTICSGGSVTLNNASTGGFPHEWDLGDGTTSTAQTVTHTYSQPGTYTVYLTVTAPNACITSDMDSIVITVNGPPQLVIQAVPPICPDSTIQLQASGGDTYLWDISPYLSNLMIPDPIANPPSTQDFYVTATNDCGSDRDTITVTIINFQLTVSDDDTICLGSSVQLFAGGGAVYQWNNAGTLNNPNISNPVATPVSTTDYIVHVTDVNGCHLQDTVHVQVDQFPNANAGPDIVLCKGSAHTFSATGGNSYSWSPPLYLNNPNIFNPETEPDQSISYVVAATNTCGTDFDTVAVTVIVVQGHASPDTIICPGTSVMLNAWGGATYTWSPASLLNTFTNDTVIATPLAPTNFIVQVTDTNGCSDYDTVFVNLFPAQIIDLGPDVLIEFGDSYQLNANGNGTFTWTPDSFLTCPTCPNPLARPVYSIQYIVTVTDTNGCRFQDSIHIFVEGSLYIPNTFTPNRDGLNDLFRAYGVDIREFTMRIFNRWGEEIFVTEKLQSGWDGTYKNSECPLGVYVWKVDYTEVSGKGGQLIGHVNLLR